MIFVALLQLCLNNENGSYSTLEFALFLKVLFLFLNDTGVSVCPAIHLFQINLMETGLPIWMFVFILFSFNSVTLGNMVWLGLLA